MYDVEMGTTKLKRVSLLAASIFILRIMCILCAQMLRDFRIVRKEDNSEGGIYVIKIGIT